jgi:uncharacterized protein YjbI with pentapeptide repeats
MLHTPPRREEITVNEQQLSRWRTAVKAAIWIVCILVALVLVISVYGGYRFDDGWKWTGIVKNAHFHRRTLWDWLDLLIVPVVLALGGYLFTRSENQRTHQLAEKQRNQDRQIAEQQRTLDRQIAHTRRQEDTLQAYLDGMSQLLTDEKRPLHAAQLGDSLSTVARARTLTVLSRLDSSRKRSVLEFLYESGLITKDRAIVNLEGADLSGVDLRRANLTDADLHGINLTEADLSGSDLRGANLRGANLRAAYLRATDIMGANLSAANLREANLRAAYLRTADLSLADLTGADLREANPRTLYDLGVVMLVGAKLQDANLSSANLGGAHGVTNEQLDQQARDLKGATMPNGQKYEEWLKSKGSQEDGKNDGSS